MILSEASRKDWTRTWTELAAAAVGASGAAAAATGGVGRLETWGDDDWAVCIEDVWGLLCTWTAGVGSEDWPEDCKIAEDWWSVDDDVRMAARSKGELNSIPEKLLSAPRRRSAWSMSCEGHNKCCRDDDDWFWTRPGAKLAAKACRLSVSRVISSLFLSNKSWRAKSGTGSTWAGMAVGNGFALFVVGRFEGALAEALLSCKCCWRSNASDKDKGRSEAPLLGYPDEAEDALPDR